MMPLLEEAAVVVERGLDLFSGVLLSHLLRLIHVCSSVGVQGSDRQEVPARPHPSEL